MLKALDHFYAVQEEPNRACLLALRQYLLQLSIELTEEWKYSMPSFYYKGKPFCYLWKDKKTDMPYILFVDGNLLQHPQLVQGNRSRMKIFYIDPLKNLPVKTINQLVKAAMALR